MEVGEEIIRWYHEYSAWELFALETCQIFHTPGVGTGNSMVIVAMREREGERERERERERDESDCIFYTCACTLFFL